MLKYLRFTSGAVFESYPNILAVQISDVVVDAILRVDPESLIALETMVKTGMAIKSHSKGS